MLKAEFVEDSEGTGFVHSSCYGEDDYYLALDNNIVIKDIVKDDGCYRDNILYLQNPDVFKAHQVL